MSLALDYGPRFTKVFDFNSLVKDTLKILDGFIVYVGFQVYKEHIRRFVVNTIPCIYNFNTDFVPCIFDCFHYCILRRCVMQIFYDNPIGFSFFSGKGMSY